MVRPVSLSLRRLPILVLLVGFFVLHATATTQAQAKKSELVVKAKVNAGKIDADGKQVLTVALAIDKTWHIYANPVPEDFPGLPTEVKVTGKAKPQDVKVDYPKGKLVKDSTAGDYNVYDESVEIKVVVQRAKGDTGPLEVNVRVQACSDKQCLLPSTLKVNVP
jgi:DsbC/DsbD-like thiol-disulfide interchange protein